MVTVKSMEVTFSKLLAMLGELLVSFHKRHQMHTLPYSTMWTMDNFKDWSRKLTFRVWISAFGL
jgi:hypothetical protein